MLKEEKELRKLVFPPGIGTSDDVKILEAIRALIRAVRTDERERCAKVAESDPHWVGREHIAAAINPPPTPKKTKPVVGWQKVIEDNANRRKA
jgi:hypothetical protein